MERSDMDLGFKTGLKSKRAYLTTWWPRKKMPVIDLYIRFNDARSLSNCLQECQIVRYPELKTESISLTLYRQAGFAQYRVKYREDISQNALLRKWDNFPFANWNGICLGLPLQLVQLMKIHFLPHLESFMWERKFEKKFFKTVQYKLLREHTYITYEK